MLGINYRSAFCWPWLPLLLACNASRLGLSTHLQKQGIALSCQSAGSSPGLRNANLPTQRSKGREGKATLSTNRFVWRKRKRGPGRKALGWGDCTHLLMRVQKEADILIDTF